MTSERDLYEKFNPHHTSTIQGVGASVHASGIGTLNVGDYKLNDVEYVPKSPVNLLSVSQYVESSGQCMIFTPSHVYVGDIPRDVLQGAHVLGERSKDLYRLIPEKPSSFWTLDLGNGLAKDSSSPSSTSTTPVGSSSPPAVVSSSTTSVSADIWHARLGHPGAVIYDKLSREIPLPKTPKKEFEVCPSCALSKGTIRKGPVSLNNATAPLQLIQVDVCGQFRYNEYIDSKLFLTIRDSYSRFYSAFPLKNKAEATTKLMNWIIEQENFYSTRGGFQVCVVRTDNGREFDNKILHEFFMDRGIVHQFTVPHQSFQNGAVERAHRTLQNTVRALLIHGGVPPFLWSEALSCAVYLINRMPIITRKGQIPYKNWHCYKMVNLDLSHLRTFGCAAYAVIPVPNRDGKLAPTSVSGVMVGYAPEQKGYKIYVPHTGKTYVSNHVRFDETVFPLSESVASHKAYDMATSALPGIPKYPSTSTEPSEIQPPRMVQPLITVAPSSSDNTIEKALSQQDELLANQNQLDQANKQLNDQQEELLVSGQKLSKEYERLSHSHTENTQELFNRTEELAERQQQSSAELLNNQEQLHATTQTLESTVGDITSQLSILPSAHQDLVQGQQQLHAQQNALADTQASQGQLITELVNVIQNSLPRDLAQLVESKLADQRLIPASSSSSIASNSPSVVPTSSSVVPISSAVATTGTPEPPSPISPVISFPPSSSPPAPTPPTSVLPEMTNRPMISNSGIQTSTAVVPVSSLSSSPPGQLLLPSSTNGPEPFSSSSGSSDLPSVGIISHIHY